MPVGRSQGDSWLLKGTALRGLPETHGSLSLPFGDPWTVSTPKDFGIKFLNLECEFLRHEMYSVWLSMPHTETTLGGASKGLLGLTLELGTKASHPQHSGRSSVQVSIGSSTLSPRSNASMAVMQPKRGTVARASSSAPDPPSPAWLPPTPRTLPPSLVPNTPLRGYHHATG